MSFLKINAFGDTNVGLVRKNNEDYLTYFEPGDPEVTKSFGRLYIAADGVGGAATGEVASKYAALKVLHTYFSQPAMKPWQRIKIGMKHANEALVAYIRQNAQARMATTMTAAAVNENQMTVVNVGDSRAYLLRDGVLKQITQDHNLVNEMIRNGVLTEEQAKTAKVKNQLTSSLGGHEVFKADVFMETIQPGDRILLCSDGFCRYAEDPEIVKKFMQTGTPEQVVANCIQYARNSGGQDNITVMALDIGEELPEIPESYDNGSLPDPVDLREVVSNPLTLEARSPNQEAALGGGNAAKGATQVVATFKPDPSVPEIPVREAYSVPGINMAADDADLMDTDNLGDKNKGNSTVLVNEETGTTSVASVTSEQLRTVASQRIHPQAPPKAPPEKVAGKSETGALSVMVIFSAVIVLILLILAGILGVRFVQKRLALNETVAPTPLLVNEAEVASPTETDLPEPAALETSDNALEEAATSEPTQEPTVMTLVSSMGECLYQVQIGETISQILGNGFGIVYDEAGEYYQRVCEEGSEPLLCEDSVVIDNHNDINLGDFLVIPDTEQTDCVTYGGVWYSKLTQ